MINIKNIKKGEIYLVALNDAIGHEQDKTRPAIVISKHERTELIVVIPLTSTPSAKDFRYTLQIKKSSTNELSKDSVALIFQIRAIYISRFLNKIGIAEDKYIESIKIDLMNFLNLK